MNKELKEYGEKHIFLLEKAINEIKEYHLQNLEGLDGKTIIFLCYFHFNRGDKF